MFCVIPSRAISPPRHNGRVGFNSKAGLQYNTQLKKCATVLIKVAVLSTKSYSYMESNSQTAEGVLLFPPN